MKRKMIEIDEKRCNGCGACIPNCPEGALQVIDGKARLVSDLFCDGLGACLGNCPQQALRVVEREAEPYDEVRVMGNIVRQGANTIAAHLRHLKAHGEFKLLETARAFLQDAGIPEPDWNQPPAAGCPGLRMLKIQRPGVTPAAAPGTGASALRQWPIQLKLLNPAADYFDDADLLVSADCVAHAYGNFHQELLNGRILIVFCPKLDGDPAVYIEKLTEIFRRHRIRSVTVARMTVPCCGGTVAIVEEAMKAAGIKTKLQIKIIQLDGSL